MARVLRLFHRTTPEAAELIRATRRMVSREHDGAVYFSTRRDGQATGYGADVVELRVPESLAQLDDEFPDGELHYRVLAKDLRPDYFVVVDTTD